MVNAKTNFSLIAITCGFLLMACDSQSTQQNTETNASSEQTGDIVSTDEKQQTMTITGILQYQKFEGGFFGFIAKDGKKYTLSGLDSEFKKDGIELELDVVAIPDVVTTTQFGQLVEVKNVAVINVPKTKPVDKSL